MIERVKKISNKKIVITTLCLMIIILILGFTYAYWTRNFTQSGVNTNTYDCFELTFSENTEGVTQTSGYPQTDAEGLMNSPYEVTITNTCNTAASYNVVLNKINTSTLDDSHIKVAVDNDIKLLSAATTTTSTIENASEGKIINTGVLAGGNSKTISIRSWMEQNTTQEEGSNKSFTYKITIEATAGGISLASLILSNNAIQSTTPDFASIPDAANTGLFKAEDDEGTSYYYRGNIENNYVDLGTAYFEDVSIYANGVNGTEDYVDTLTSYEEAVEYCNEYYLDYGYLDDQSCISDIQDYSVKAGEKMLWRIVRINGDGTIRLITDNIVGYLAFNTTYKGHKYVGYTYDNSAANIQDGTESSAKLNLEIWYKANITNKGLDSIIAPSSYCNDTSISNISGNTYYYGADDRIKNSSPILTCPTTEQTYGGKYVSKIGLLSIDEMMMAGYSKDAYKKNSNYLWNPSFWMSDSPSYSDSTRAGIFLGGCGGDITTAGSHFNYGERPVINLKSEILASSGNGTSSSPYIVSVS